MFRRVVPILMPTYRDITDRLDSFEKEVIELKAFRQAVETTSPQVAEAARLLIKTHMLESKANDANLSDPLSAQEFVELTQFYAVQKPRSFKFENLLYITTPDQLLNHAALVHREYLVRIAQRAQKLKSAPYGLSQMPSIQELKRWYQWSFHDMRNTPKPTTKNECYVFDHLVRRVFIRHYNVSSLLSSGMRELANREQWTEIDEMLMKSYADMEEFFAEFCTGRVLLRFLVGNYMYLSNKILDVKPDTFKDYDLEGRTIPLFFDHNPDDFVGQICKKCSLFTLLKYAVQESQKGYEDAEIELKLAGDKDLTFIGVPYIVYDIVSAMIDDAVQANLSRQEQFGTPCTKIEVTLAQREGNKNYVVRISDTAGGMRLNQSGLLLSCWSTYKAMEDHLSEANVKTWIHSPIRLPYAYCAARAMGGNISIASIEGYGTDRQLYMPSEGAINTVI